MSSVGWTRVMISHVISAWWSWTHGGHVCYSIQNEAFRKTAASSGDACFPIRNGTLYEADGPGGAEMLSRAKYVPLPDRACNYLPTDIHLEAGPLDISACTISANQHGI